MVQCERHGEHEVSLSSGRGFWLVGPHAMEQKPFRASLAQLSRAREVTANGTAFKERPIRKGGGQYGQVNETYVRAVA